ncbi:porin [Albitalea terrae]|uniref:Porin n=1 Tax=Piscinibacter terrae TaxID=2496871 RepID=A0A3N7HU30_9BURK|nr:porin [Albitalea terrae]
MLLASLSGALPAAAVHAEGTITLFGMAYGQFENVSATGATNPAQDKPSRFRLSNVSSDLGVKGTLPLMDGVSGVFQYSTGVNVDNASNNTAGGMWANAKDTFVGLSIANVGTVKFGRLTGAARWNSGTPDFSPAGAGPQDNQAALSSISGQTGAGPLFNVRIDNALGFESASWSGLSVRAYFGANENKSAATVASGSLLDDKSYSLGAQYVIGPVDLRGSYEIRNDKGTLNNTTTNRTKDKDYRFGVRYTLPDKATIVAFGYDRMSFLDQDATAAQKTYIKKTGWVIGARHEFGQHVVYGGYGKAGDVSCSIASGAVCDGGNTGGKQFVVAYNFTFNKQMLAEAYVSRVTNGTRGKYDFDSGGVGGIGAGSRPTAMGFGLRYTF